MKPDFLVKTFPIQFTSNSKTQALLRLGAAISLALVTCLAQEPADAADGSRDFTFFMSSDCHIGLAATNAKPPLNQDQVIAQARDTVNEMLGLVGQPYPTGEPFTGLGLGTIGKPRGIIIAGDLTDKGDWTLFDTVFPATGVGAGSVPLYICVGNHDGPADGPVRRGVIARNRQREMEGKLDGISSNGLHYAWNWEGVHFVCVNLCPADTTDSETPFKYGQPGPGSWNDPAGALSFLTNYLHERVGASGEPVIIWQHYGYCEGFNFDWNWWTAKQRRAFYDAVKDYNVVALLHGHTHSPARYQWPDPVHDAPEVQRLFGDNPPANLRSFDVFSGGSFGAGAPDGGTFYLFHILNDRLIAVHYDRSGSSKNSQLNLVKSLLFTASPKRN